MNTQKIYNSLEEYFKPHLCSEILLPKGVQYSNSCEIHKVYTANFADLCVIQEILARGERGVLLFTHHPRPQKSHPYEAYSDIPTTLLSQMKEQGLSLFSYHIPLDKNGLYSPGNNLAQALGLTPFSEFYLQNEVLMGVICRGDFLSTSQLLDKMEKLFGHPCKCYPYGGGKIQDGKVAIMAGGASNEGIYEQLSTMGVNTFVTGMTNPLRGGFIPKIHEKAKENHINLIGGTHYSTEKYACIKMVDFFKSLGLPCEFIESTFDLTDI